MWALWGCEDDAQGGHEKRFACFLFMTSQLIHVFVAQELPVQLKELRGNWCSTSGGLGAKRASGTKQKKNMWE